MKLKTLLSASIASVMLALTSCTDLGFGVDVNSGGVSPYFYGSDNYGRVSVGGSWSPGYLGGPYWGGNSYYPPYYGYGPGTIVVPSRPNYRPQPSRPPQRPGRPEQPDLPQQPNRPVVGTSARPTFEVDANLRPITRPGNFGLPDADNK